MVSHPGGYLTLIVKLPFLLYAWSMTNPSPGNEVSFGQKYKSLSLLDRSKLVRDTCYNLARCCCLSGLLHPHLVFSCRASITMAFCVGRHFIDLQEVLNSWTLATKCHRTGFVTMASPNISHSYVRGPIDCMLLWLCIYSASVSSPGEQLPELRGAGRGG